MIATADVITADVDTTATATAAMTAMTTPATPDNQPPAHQYPHVLTPLPLLGEGRFVILPSSASNQMQSV